MSTLSKNRILYIVKIVLPIVLFCGILYFCIFMNEPYYIKTVYYDKDMNQTSEIFQKVPSGMTERVAVGIIFGGILAGIGVSAGYGLHIAWDRWCLRKRKRKREWY